MLGCCKILVSDSRCQLCVDVVVSSAEDPLERHTATHQKTVPAQTHCEYSVGIRIMEESIWIFIVILLKGNKSHGFEPMHL